MQQITVVSLDPGPEVSGMVILRYGEIVKAGNLPKADILFNIMKERKSKVPMLVLIEDVKPYGTRLSQDLLDTAKWIGELCYRLKSLGIEFVLVSRSTVRKWIFDTFNDIVVPLIEKLIADKDYRRKDGELFRPSHRFIGDRTVIVAMKKCWSISTPKPGKTNEYGIRKDSWNALALASYYLQRPHASQ